jgi:FkbH-like protein
MKLAEALTIVQKTSAKLPELPVALACGITPLHLQNYFAAHLQSACPDRKVRVSTGLFGDLAGTVEQLATQSLHAIALVMEWSDLDPRLGYRQLGGWGSDRLSDCVDVVRSTLLRLERAIDRFPVSTILAISLPGLPLPPAFHTSGWQASGTELALNQALLEFANRVSARASIRVVNREKLDGTSPPATRYDFRSDLHTGFPYTIAYADALSAALANLIVAAPPKKGLITDLDDTFWSGLVGEVGHESVSWDLASHTQVHGLFQQMLGMLADHGVLVGIASKNSPEVVDRALARADLAISREKLFPVEVHWEPKSGSVSRILKTWNIGADSVVFVDDSPMELEEVRAAHPGIECLLFPKNDYAAALSFLHRLRDLFGKPALSEEDALRLNSIRVSQELAHQNGDAGSPEAFLSALKATITLQHDPPAQDDRPLELVNKTNQFNLNGIRYTQSEWHEAAHAPGAFVIAVSYADKFGPLGKIGVILGRHEGQELRVRTWVLSCRAFSRRIEHACLKHLFGRFGTDRVVFDFRPTPKNGPTSDFFRQFADVSTEPVEVSRLDFERNGPALYHEIIETNG